MPELPDVIVYIEALAERIIGRRVEEIRLLSPFVLRSVDPPIDVVRGAVVKGLRRIGKRIVFVFDSSTLRLLRHAQGSRAGRGARACPLPRHSPDDCRASSMARARSESSGSVRRSSSRPSSSSTARCSSPRPVPRSARRCSWCAAKRLSVALDPGGVEPLDASFEEFRRGLTRENHTLKRALTDPQLFSGIGNAYSDEILHAARLSPLKLSQSLSDEEVRRLLEATRSTLTSLGRSSAQGGRVRASRRR